jgi:hypothetical protein
MAIDRIDATTRATSGAEAAPAAPPAAPAAPDAQKQLDAALARMAALEARVAELSNRQAAAEQQGQRLRDAEVRGEADKHAAARAVARQKVDEAMRPTAQRTLLEIVELGLRLLPLVNALIALVRIGRMAWAAIDPQRRQDFDWSQEWTRLAIDVAGVAGGVLIPGIGGALGATGALAANLVYTDPANEGLGVRGGSSQLFGGLNELFDDYPVRNAWRERAAEGLDLVKAGAGRARDLAGADRAVERGSSDDDGSRPLLPRGAAPGPSPRQPETHAPGPLQGPLEVGT